MHSFTQTITKPKRMRVSLFLPIALLFAFVSCKKADSTSTGRVAFEYQFDTDQVRLNNIGQPAPLPSGHAAQTPDFRSMSVHYIELAPTAFTLLGQGQVIYKGAETTKGGENAVDFDQAPNLAAGQQFAEVDLSKLAPGTYEWVRASVTYQNYDIKFTLTEGATQFTDQLATVASFVGFNTYIGSVKPFDIATAVNANKKQGFWGVETRFGGALSAFNQVITGQAPAGATTVVNPLFASSPVPQGSCVVTGKFAEPLVITGNETGKLLVSLSFSVNQSFEWEDKNGDNRWDINRLEPTKTESVKDMGLRGLIPKWRWE
jgi:hypothetical protein